MMNVRQRTAFDNEIALARELIAGKKYDRVMPHLERAHVLGQMYVRPHVLVHALMLRLAVHQRDVRSALGQVVRCGLGAIGSALGRVPVGNTGGSNVSMFQRMPISPELTELMGSDAAKKQLDRLR